MNPGLPDHWRTLYPWFLLHYFVLLLKDIQFLSWSFPFLTTSKFYRMQFRQFIAWNIGTIFPLFLFSSFCSCSFCLYVDITATGLCNKSFFTPFNVVLESLHPQNPQCWRVIFLLFLAYIICLCYILYLRHHFFLFFGPFVSVSPLTVLRMVPRIIKWGLTKY